ncbi:tol-pal system protein YbgF [Octadecabacter sp. 1_MG-2023]|uniref:tol-pal system protein YbgF n=1 Tax=unclassified Octadecabacter TaxID=196158 RepID=UPI001C08E484|nr:MULTISPECIES: tol-pal system protein YbgF [unclassified Octadecabacter]MBU2991981.1 tol-pal system protein YbgF [Octadecabacter sp. B2R22]MDO6735955.1 tol-pal system protein YbgF [Octadecabacter sp. 1_MG-2023]
MLRTISLCLALAAPAGLMSSAAFAQDQTLADIRAELTTLYVDVTGLRNELVASGQSGQGTAGATPLDRLNSIEAELTRLTSKTEELEFRITRLTRDGTNRIGDLEFRLCELEAGCDIGALGETPSLGGVDVEPTAPVVETPVTNAPSLAVAEQEDFTRAQEALASGDFRGAADLLASFNENYPGSPVAADAHFLRGQAFENLGETSNAARAYLSAFSGNPEGSIAPAALMKLGVTLGALGQTQDACVTLGEVNVRFPGTPEVGEAQNAMATLGCG